MAANRYLLTAATLAGIAAGSIGTATLTARAGIPTDKVYEPVPVTFTNAQVANATGAQIAQQVCNGVDTELALAGADACALTDLRYFCVAVNQPEHGQSTIRGAAVIPGEWVPGGAE